LRLAPSALDAGYWFIESIGFIGFIESKAEIAGLMLVEGTVSGIADF